MPTTTTTGTTERTTESFISIDGRYYTVAEARRLLRIPKHACFGCYLGDCAPETHDTCPIGDLS